VLAGTLFAAASLPAVAAKGPEYTYFDVGYVNIDADQIESDGLGVNLSFGATEHVFLKFGYQRQFVDESVSPFRDYDADRFQIGGGMHFGVTDTIDVLGAVSYLDVEYSNGRPAEADEGYLVEAGVRAMLSKKLELNATLSGLHFDGEDDVGLGFGGVYDLTRTFALTGSYNRFDDAKANEFFLGLRVEF
jgi:hypothetical protein